MWFLRRLFSPYAAHHARLDRIDAMIKDNERRLVKQNPNFLVRYAPQLMMSGLLLAMEALILRGLTLGYLYGHHYPLSNWIAWGCLALVPLLCIAYLFEGDYLLAKTRLPLD